MAEKKDYFELLVNKFTEESAKEFREILLSECKKDVKKPTVVWIDTKVSLKEFILLNFF